jgi:glucokinase
VVAGLDVGGTKVLGRALRPDRPTEVLAERRVPTPRGAAAVLAALAAVVDVLARDPRVLDAGGLVGVGVGLPGLVEGGHVLRYAANLDVGASAQPGGWPLGPLLAARTGLPVVVDNDANCALLCEHRLGVARDRRDVVLVTLGTGIGGGLLAGGQLWRGSHGFAAEPGHLVVDPSGPRCPCGRRGCWERYASGSGLARMAREAAEAGRAPGLLARVGGRSADLRGEHVGTAAAQGDPEALAILGELAGWLALGVANLVTLLDPELVVVGGGLAGLDELLLGPARAALPELVLGGRSRPCPPLVRAELGPEAGVIGAGLLATRQ